MPLPPGFIEDKPAAGPPPGFKEDSSGLDWGGVVKDALNEARMGNGSKMRALMTDPVTQAKVLPYLTGAVGSAAPIPFGATVGTVGGRALSDAALAAYGKPEEIPSTGQHVLEGGLALAGDLTAFPAINKSRYGAQVGKAESAGGIPNLPESLKRPGGPAPTTEWIDSTKQVMDSGEKVTPKFLKQISDQIDFIFKNRKDVPLTGADEAKLAQLNTWAQSKLNSFAPGRAVPAANLARSQIVPNTMVNAVRKLPWWAKGAASVVGGDALLQALRHGK